MKRFFAFILAWFLTLWAPVYCAVTIDELWTWPVKGDPDATDTAYLVEHDGLTGATVIQTPGANNSLCIFGFDVLPSLDTTITYYSNLTELFEQDLKSDMGFSVVDVPWKCTAKGEALKIDADQAVKFYIRIREKRPTN